jgi:erythronate-4-phosphate dehydrogenase
MVGMKVRMEKPISTFQTLQPDYGQPGANLIQNNKLKIVVDNKIPFIKGALENAARIIYLPGDKIGPEDIRDADALIIRTRTHCKQSLLEGSTVKFIATATIGFDHIDTNYCEERGIIWTNAPGCNSSSVEQYIISTLLYLASMQGFDLKSKTLGIIGVGNVGSKVQRAAEILGMKVILNDPPRAAKEGREGFATLQDLLQSADIISMHVPLINEDEFKTRAMADASFFESMKQDSIFINTSRGEVVLESALKQAIRNDKLSDVVLDVFDKEPKVDKELLAMLTIATPHIAGYSAEGKANGTMMSVNALSKFFNLGLDDWKPGGIPTTGNMEIQADGADAEYLDLIFEVYSQSYSVQEDHDRFMDNMDRFEKLRGDYRIRREPSAYSVRVFNDDGLYRKIFEGLGFNVLGDACF